MAGRQQWSTRPYAPTRPAQQRPCARPGHPLGVRVLRGLSGVLTGGLVVLAVAVGMAQWLIGSAERPGPGPGAVVGHTLAALAAVGLQLVADRSRGPRAVLAAGSVVLLTALVLWFGWYA